MKTPALFAAAAIALTAFSTQAQAQYGGTTAATTYKHACRQNAMWPSQYIASARCSVNSPFQAMANNGWRRQNLMSSFHFNAETNELTQAGRLKADWTLTQAPAQRRNLFVQQAAKPEATADRVQALQEYAANVTIDGNPAAVNETHIREMGHPASSVDAVFVGFGENQPAPILPAPTASAGS